MIGSNEIATDLLKTLGEWALTAGRFYQSSQTGYVHLYYKERDEKAQTIPVLENVLFALALLRSRLVEQIQEAKKMLKSLLFFQNQHSPEERGNFPTYLHEYPVCSDPALALQLLAPFYWILKQFGHVLGSDLKHQLEHAVHLALDHSLRLHQNKPFPYSLAVRLASAQFALGSLWNDKLIQEMGKEALKNLADRQLEGWHTTRHLADILVGLQMVYPSLSDSPWSLLWQRIEKTRHSKLACYMGPCVREWQEGEEPQVSLYDLFGGFFGRQFSRRASVLNPHHLHGILIQASLDKFRPILTSFLEYGKLKDQDWCLRCYPDWTYLVLEKNEPYQPTQDKTHTSFQLLWGNCDRLHSLVCQGGNSEKIKFHQEEKSIILTFDLKDSEDEEENTSKKEVEFFLDFHANFSLSVNGQLSNTFELGQLISFSFNQMLCSIELNLIQGEGNFIGHIMRGQRPSQVNQKRENRYQAYDWVFFLRTIRRQKNCKIQAKIQFQTIDF